jgi:hypothetical protein
MVSNRIPQRGRTAFLKAGVLDLRRLFERLVVGLLLFPHETAATRGPTSSASFLVLSGLARLGADSYRSWAPKLRERRASLVFDRNLLHAVARVSQIEVRHSPLAGPLL